MNFKTQKFLVAGLSRSGIAAADLLLARGAAVYLYDDRPAALESEQARALRAAGARAVYVLCAARRFRHARPQKAETPDPDDLPEAQK